MIDEFIIEGIERGLLLLLFTKKDKDPNRFNFLKLKVLSCGF